MQAVILVSGRGTRMAPLTDKLPKPMLLVGEKNLIEHKLDVLPPEISEVVLIVGYLGQKIFDYFGDNYKGRPIKYVWQDGLRGTADALFQAEDVLGDRFIVMAGDDLYNAEDIKMIIKEPLAVMVSPVEAMSSGGLVVVDQSGNLSEIIEGGDHGGRPGLVYTSLCSLTKDIFKEEMVQIPGRDEFGLPQTIVSLSKKQPVKVLTTTRWCQITSPEDLIIGAQFIKG